MDYQNYTLNIIFDDNTEAHVLPHDLELDIWFTDPDINGFLQAVQGVKRTRMVTKGVHPTVVQAQVLLEEKILNNTSLVWVRPLN